jgi:hypothetical protein
VQVLSGNILLGDLFVNRWHIPVQSVCNHFGRVQRSDSCSIYPSTPGGWDPMVGVRLMASLWLCHALARIAMGLGLRSVSNISF